jgi:hypothetical protein
MQSVKDIVKSRLSEAVEDSFSDEKSKLNILSAQLARPFLRIADHIFFPSKFSEDIDELKYSKSELVLLYSNPRYLRASEHMEVDFLKRAKELEGFENRPSDEFCHLVADKFKVMALVSKALKLIALQKQPTQAAKRINEWAFCKEFYEDNKTKAKTLEGLEALLIHGNSKIVAPSQIHMRLSGLLPFFCDNNIISLHPIGDTQYLKISEKLTLIDGLLSVRVRKKPQLL